MQRILLIVLGVVQYIVGQSLLCTESKLSVGSGCTQLGNILNETAAVDYLLPQIPQGAEFDLVLTLTVLKGVADLAVGEVVYLNSVQEHKSTRTLTSRSESVRVSRQDLQDHSGVWIARVTTESPNVFYILSVEATNNSITLVEQQRQVIEKIGDKCCAQDKEECELLKTVSGGQDLCHTPPNFCNENGELTVLDLTHFDLQCELPIEIAQIETLQVLDLPSFKSGKTSTLEQIVQSVSGLERLKIQNSQISGNLTCNLTSDSLKLLDLSQNLISGSIPGCIMNMSSLEYLDIMQNKLSGELPDVVEGSQLRVLLLGSQQVGISGQLPSMIQAEQLEFLFVDHNLLKGTLPELPTSMKEINLMSNKIGGAIPESYAGLVKLTAFEVSNNSLSGTLPEVLATMQELQVLDVSHNALKGFIPHKWTAPNLKQVQLGGNKLFGTLPVSLGQLPHAVIVSVHNNGLSGTLHSYAIGIPDNNYVLEFDVSNNGMSGDIPDELSKLALFHDRLVLDPGPNVFSIENNNFDGNLPHFVMKGMLDPEHLLVKVQGNYFACPASIPTKIRSTQLNELQCHDDEQHTMVVFADLPSTQSTTEEEDTGGSGSVGIGIVLSICFMVFGVVLLSVISFFACRMYQKRRKQYMILQENSLKEKQAFEGVTMDSQSNPPERIKQIPLQEQRRNNNISFQYNGKSS